MRCFATIAGSSFPAGGATPLPEGGAGGRTDGDMTTFDSREQALEAMFVHDEEMKFRALARRNRLLGLWAAEKLGKDGEAAQAYAKAVVMSDFEEEGDHDVFRKLRRDFDDAGVEQSDHQIRRTMDELLGAAIEQLSREN